MSINVDEEFVFACSACIIIMCDAFLDKVNHHFCIFLHFVFPWFTVTLEQAECFRPHEFVCLHSPAFAPCVKAIFKNRHKFISLKYYYKDLRSHWIHEINRDGLFPLQSSRCHMTLCCLASFFFVFHDQLVCCQLPPAHPKHHSAFPGWALHVMQVVGQRGW